ncbi:hypothetical protein [Rhodopseudomonas palustris]|uniref:hypothetical protein n=1 Tax=Rhodopseudomonas palustris TaxID=1076 RepID=UPI0021F25836|nr:hypothetical protein [Rhodopseudomonas palustris]UYO51732.1 hypothetical protein KQX61_13995 [Rhodopseudomonas palustris]
MNAERLRAVLDLLLQTEKDGNIQPSIEQVAFNLAVLASTPGPEQQTKLAKSLDLLDQRIRVTCSKLNPIQRSGIKSVNADNFFSPSMVDQIRHVMTENAFTPAVGSEFVNNLVEERKSFLNIIRNTRSGLRNLGVSAVSLEPGHADASFLIPRSLFQNDLDGLQRELKTLSSMLRVFYELSNVTPSTIEVHEISTSDPTFFLGIDVSPLILLGLAIKWCIEVIKGGHDIKKIAEDARKAAVPENIVNQLEKTLQDQIDKKLENKVDQLLADFGGTPARRNELRSPSRLALEQLLQRVERGMIIEIHAELPRIENGTEDSGETARLRAEIERLKEIADSLKYPEIEGQPVLQLTTGDDQAGRSNEAPLVVTPGGPPPQPPSATL